MLLTVSLVAPVFLAQPQDPVAAPPADPLREVVDHYNHGGTPNTWQDPQITELQLTDTEVDQVVAFLFSLTDRRFAAQNRAAIQIHGGSDAIPVDGHRRSSIVVEI